MTSLHISEWELQNSDGFSPIHFARSANLPEFRDIGLHGADAILLDFP